MNGNLIKKHLKNESLDSQCFSNSIIRRVIDKRNENENKLKRFKFVKEKVMDEQYTVGKYKEEMCLFEDNNNVDASFNIKYFKNVELLNNASLLENNYGLINNEYLHNIKSLGKGNINMINNNSYGNIYDNIYGNTNLLKYDTLNNYNKYVDRRCFVPPLNSFISDSGKLSKIDELLTTLKREKHRVLIYFQMTKMMDLFEEYLVRKEFVYLRLDGTSKIKNRKELVESWQRNNDILYLC